MNRRPMTRLELLGAVLAIAAPWAVVLLMVLRGWL